jgi:hypothetical protein
MSREVLLWPVNKDTEALAYCDFADAAYAALTGNPSDVWCYRNRRDKNGKMYTPYLGPTGGEWYGDPMPEPSGGPALRASATLVDHIEYPDAPDDPWG